MGEILIVVAFWTQLSHSQQQDKAEDVKVGAFEDKGPGTGREDDMQDAQLQDRREDMQDAQREKRREDMQDAQPHNKVANGFRVRAFSWKSTSASPSHVFQVSRCQCKCVACFSLFEHVLEQFHVPLYILIAGTPLSAETRG